jgi:predicted transcriptional regulator
MARERELPPPLEMICLNALWDIGEGNVEEVRRVVARSRPLAYTTVLTLLDRLTRRGAVARRKEGRGFRYQPTVERDALRRMALRQFLEYHFEGSAAKLKVFLEVPIPENPVPEIPPQDAEPVPAEATEHMALAAGAPGSDSQE